MDRAKALAWHLERAVTCSGCGFPLDETLAPENEGAYTATKVVCHACRARGHAAEAQGEHDDRAGVMFTVDHEPGR